MEKTGAELVNVLVHSWFWLLIALLVVVAGWWMLRFADNLVTLYPGSTETKRLPPQELPSRKSSTRKAS